MTAGLAGLAFWVAAGTPSKDGGRYHGRVIDARTKPPLEGVTDRDGRFSVDATPRRNWSRFRAVREQPEIRVFNRATAATPTPTR